MTLQQTVYRLLLAGLLLAMLVLPVVNVAADADSVANHGAHSIVLPAETQDIPAHILTCDPGGSAGGACGG